MSKKIREKDYVLRTQPFIHTDAEQWYSRADIFTLMLLSAHILWLLLTIFQ